MKNEPKVAIIIVNYNGFSDTVECIQSIEKNDYGNYQIVVVDNASTTVPLPEEKQYLESHAIYIQSHTNAGFSAGNNIGIQLAMEKRAEYVLLINGDTTVEPDFLSKLMAAANAHPEAGIVCGRIMYYDTPQILWYGGGTIDFKTGNTVHTGWGKNIQEVELKSGPVTFSTGCLMLIPVSVFRKTGFLGEEYFLYCEDTDYSCRVQAAGYSIYYCNDAVIYHKVSRSVGQASATQQYYMTRNTQYLVRACLSDWKTACFCTFVRDVKSLIRGRLKLSIFIRAYRDVWKRRMGKVTL